MADGIQELEAFYEKMLASEKEYLQEKAKIEAQEEARARQKYADNLEQAKSSARRQDVITQESLRRQKKALAELKEQAQADREAFEILQKSLSVMLSDVADQAEDSFSRIQKAEESLSDKLKKDASQFREIT
ncbi:MAG: hypothetical protein IJO50_05170, partial [Clostridia bacterium]|nr:hypothetical protein [Clostridia bacterium]